MKLKFTVECEARKTQGKFAAKGDVSAEILDALEGADPSSITVGDSEYEVENWFVTSVE